MSLDSNLSSDIGYKIGKINLQQRSFPELDTIPRVGRVGWPTRTRSYGPGSTLLYFSGMRDSEKTTPYVPGTNSCILLVEKILWRFKIRGNVWLKSQ